MLNLTPETGYTILGYSNNQTQRKLNTNYIEQNSK